MFETILFEKRQAVAWITFNRPQVHNAINLRMRDELWEALLAVRDDPDVAVAVLAGAGEEAFSAGADLSEFGTAPSYIQARTARLERDLWGLALTLEKPLIAAIHGYALGAGLELALACDLRISAANAVLGFPEVERGYIPVTGGTQMLPRMVRMGPALELLVSGEPVGAQEALRLGLVHKVVPAPDLAAEAERLAVSLAARSPAAVRAAKRALREGMELSLERGLALEAALGATLASEA